MHRQWLVGALGLALIGGGVAGCQSKREQAREQTQEAREAERQAQEQLRQGDVEEAREQEREALEQRREAAETTAEAEGGRVPVAGQGYASLEKTVKDELGADWTVQSTGDRLTATRLKTKPAARDLNQKMNEAMTEVRRDWRTISVTHQADAVQLDGNIDSCDKLGDIVDKFAGIDGINRIVVRARCTMEGGARNR